MDLSERFWRHVDRSGECWLWAGAREQEGYGRFTIARAPVRAHRIAWQITLGDIPDGLCVLHRCDNRLCVRPEHLFLGTRLDNNRDRDEKGRSATGRRHGTHTHPESYRGERSSSAKLTTEAVRRIRELHRAGEPKLRLARQFGMSRTAIRAVLDGTTWGWLS